MKEKEKPHTDFPPVRFREASIYEYDVLISTYKISDIGRYNARNNKISKN